MYIRLADRRRWGGRAACRRVSPVSCDIGVSLMAIFDRLVGLLLRETSERQEKNEGRPRENYCHTTQKRVWAKHLGMLKHLWPGKNLPTRLEDEDFYLFWPSGKIRNGAWASGLAAPGERPLRHVSRHPRSVMREFDCAG